MGLYFYLERLNKNHVNLNDFSVIYEENQDVNLEFKSISNIGTDGQYLTLNSMVNAVKTFDQQGTGFISINELKFSTNYKNRERERYVLIIFIVLTGLGDKLNDIEFDDLRQFMEISPNGQVSYERK